MQSIVNIDLTAGAKLLMLFELKKHNFYIRSITDWSVKTRTYSSLSAAAEESGRCRIYGGIHFKHTCLPYSSRCQ